MTTSRLEFLLTANDKASAVFSRVNKELTGIGSAAGALRTAFSGIGAALGAGISVAGLVALGRATVNGLDKLNDLADATGATVENLSALEDVALRTGTSVETAGDAVIKLNKALADAKPGSEAEAAFRALGLSVEELKRQDPVQALQAVARALAGFADDGNKARVVQELFGKSLREVAPLLNDLAKAGKLNATVTSEAAAEAEKFNQALTALQKNATDTARSLAGPLLRSVNALFDAWRNGQASGKGYLASLIDIEKVERIVKNNAGTYSNEGRNYPKASLPAALALPDKTKVAAARRAGAKDDALVGPEVPQALKDAQAAIAQTDIAKIEKLRDTLRELTTLPASAGRDSAIQALLDDLENLDPALRLARDNAAKLREILEQTPSGKSQGMVQQIEFINEQFSAGKIANVQQWAEAIRVATGTASDGIEEVAKESRSAVEDLALVFSSAAGQAIANFSSLRDVLKGVLADIAQIAIRETVTKPLTALASSFFGSFGFRAAGGPVSAGSPYIVGEQGPELFVPSTSGHIVANGAGGGMVMQTTINIDSRTDSAQVGALVAQGVQQGQQQMLTYLKTQGVVA